MDAIIADKSLQGAIENAVAKKRVSLRADVELFNRQLTLDQNLRASMEDALAKKRASIEADIVVEAELVAHMKRLRDINVQNSLVA